MWEGKKGGRKGKKEERKQGRKEEGKERRTEGGRIRGRERRKMETLRYPHEQHWKSAAKARSLEICSSPFTCSVRLTHSLVGSLPQSA